MNEVLHIWVGWVGWVTDLELLELVLEQVPDLVLVLAFLLVDGDASHLCGWVGGWVGCCMHRKVEENEAVGMSYCALGGWVGG